MRKTLATSVCLVVLGCFIAHTWAADPAAVPDAKNPQAQKPVVELGKKIKIYDPNVGEYDKYEWYINDHCLICDLNGQWHLYGITGAMPIKPIYERLLAHASAKSLLQQPWDKYHHALTYAPQAPWREFHLWAPHVVEHEGTYYMFYCAGNGDKDNSKYHLNLATSKDCNTWVRHPANPMIVDGFDARDPYVTRWGDKWVMYYTATTEPKGGNHCVAYMTSDDLIHWGNRSIAYTDPAQGKWGGPCESPQVVRRGDKYYLMLGPRNGDRIEYIGTDVYVSDNPYHWEHKDKVAHLAAHAPEVIRDKDGKWYLSDCGWGRRGVFLAPLIWNDGLENPETNIAVPK